ncbi:MAG: LUD domain-containing protein [Actinobacteria bacterium]|nr:LUD domain-containing protein [Actinomycetota bacterium]
MEHSAFLARVRDRLGGDEVPPLPETLPPTQSSGDGRLFERFDEQLEKVGGEVRRVAAGEIAAAIAELAAGEETAVVATGVGDHLEAVTEGLRRAGCRAVEPTREASASAGLGITGAALGVASTGSVLLPMGPDSPRVASLLPPHHVVILPEDRLAQGFEELYAAMPGHARSASQVVLVTGPSRTADIEMTIVRGVHGPARLTVLVVGG